jgi:hypothetical protein
MNRRELIKLGALAPLMAWFERVFGRFLPEPAREKVRGYRVYLDGECVEFPDAVSAVNYDPSEPFSMSFWFKTKDRSPARTEVITRAEGRVPALRVKVAKLFGKKPPDGKWHRFTCRYDGSKKPPKIIAHDPPPGAVEFWRG